MYEFNVFVCVFFSSLPIVSMMSEHVYMYACALAIAVIVRV